MSIRKYKNALQNAGIIAAFSVTCFGATTGIVSAGMPSAMAAQVGTGHPAPHHGSILGGAELSPNAKFLVLAQTYHIQLPAGDPLSLLQEGQAAAASFQQGESAHDLYEELLMRGFDDYSAVNLLNAALHVRGLGL